VSDTEEQVAPPTGKPRKGVAHPADGSTSPPVSDDVRDPVDNPYDRVMPNGDEPLDAAVPDEDVEEVDAGLVPAGNAYPEPAVQRLQSVTSAASRNHGGNAVDYEKEARKVDTPERDGIHIGKDLKRVWYKTFRLGIPPGASLEPHQHEGNMRQTVEDVLKGGERVSSATTLHSVTYDKANRQTLMTYKVELDGLAPKPDVEEGDPTVATDVAPLVGQGVGDPAKEKVTSSA
jgi:hypothetical protein